MATEGKPTEHPRIGILSQLVAGSYASTLISWVVAATQAAGARVVAIQTLDLAEAGSNAWTPGGVGESDGLGWPLGWPPGSGSAPPRFGARVAWDQVGGFLVVLDAVEPWYLHALRAAGKPVVLISQSVEGFPCPVVQSDNRAGALHAVSHLIGHGHRRIAFVGALTQSDTIARYDAYREGLSLHGIEPDPDLLFEATDNLEGGGEVAARRLLAAGLPSTAVVAATDYNAIGIMRALRAAGIILPRDQAIVGFDDVEASSWVEPSLSTVHQSFEELARTSAELLLEMMRDEYVSPGLHLVPTAFVARESCGCTAATESGDSGAGEAANGLSPRQRLRLRLEEKLTRGEVATAGQRSALDRAVELVALAAEPGSEGTPTAPDGIREAAAALYSVSPRWTVITDTVACLRRYREDLQLMAAGLEAVARFDHSITETVIELSRSLAQADAALQNELHRAMSQDHALSVSLLGDTAGDPEALGWLSHTPAEAGCLGLWSSESRGDADVPGLDLAASYVRSGGRLALPARVRAEEFPPDALLDDLTWGPSAVAVVFPTKTRTVDLGLLALVTPIHPAQESGRDRLFENNALLSVALERQVMLDRLQRSNADLATFSHAMAHDLRNPLATIAMWASVARTRASPGDDAAPVLQIVDRIREVAEYANDLVVDLLRYAELDREATSLELVDLNLAASRVLATIGSTIAEQGADVETGELPTVRGRAAELQLVLQNLIGNAIKYRGPQPPRIRIEAAPGQGAWTILCRDNGQGIPDDVAERAFEPFVRGHPSISGSGLGLATCRRIVEAHGGRIWIAASGEDGTTIAFTLPAGSAPEPTDGEATGQVASQGAGARRRHGGRSRRSRPAA